LQQQWLALLISLSDVPTEIVKTSGQMFEYRT
jgi:hypothetical protein